MKNNRTKFSGEKYYNEAFRVEYFSRIRTKTQILKSSNLKLSNVLGAIHDKCPGLPLARPS